VSGLIDFFIYFFFKERSAKGHMQIPCEIGDVPNDKAVEYLVDGSVPRDVASKWKNSLEGVYCSLIDF
jgi:hypothetical protein